MKVICYGDSNTYGYDPRLGSPGRLPSNQRWTGILNALPEYEIVNEGMNGRTIPTENGGRQWLGKAIKRNEDADALVIMLGTNDMFMVPGATAGVLADRMRATFANVPELIRFRDTAGKRIFLVSPPPPALKVLFYQMAGVPVSQKAEEAARIVRELPAEYAKVAEEYKTGFIDAGGWNIDLFFDGLHFSEAGHREFARRMRRALGDGSSDR